MKLSWKIFFITTPLFVLFLTLFGTWIVQKSFQSNLTREIESCLMENEMFQTSYELTLNGMSSGQRKKTSVRAVVEPFHQAMDSTLGCARIYDDARKVLYQDNELTVSHRIWEELEKAASVQAVGENSEDARSDQSVGERSGNGKTEDAPSVQSTGEDGGADGVLPQSVGHAQTSDASAGAYNVGRQIVRQDGEYYVAVLARSSSGVWFETLHNVSSVFEDRDDIYSSYQAGMLLVAFFSGLFTLLALLLVMRNTQKLSSATRRFAMGRYDTRVSIRSDDEIGRLADDFNWMANVMNRQMEQLQDDVRRQEEFTSAFAHELKTPLTSIIGYAETMRSMDLTKEESDMCADYIYRQGKRLQSLSYKLLEMAMADQYQMIYRNVSVKELFDEAAKTMEMAFREKHLVLLVEQDDGYILGDRVLLSSLLFNLLDNARKASSDGGRIWLTGKAMTGGGYSITVEDEGKGIPPEELNRITEAFYMVDKSRSRKEGGAGLGLALCKKILELHEGSWQMVSEPGKGMRVVVLLGAPAANGNARRRPRRARRRQGTGGGTMDDPVNKERP